MKPSSEFYSIIDYSASNAEDQAKIASAFAEIQKEWVASYPGYSSARFLASTDGLIVRAIVEWETEDAFHSFERESDSKGRMAALERAFRELSTQGSRQTFVAIGEVRP
ncbi:antibiotic biosynthesis monooxygenase [Qingshengfaniella alkalisoli]|uniref:antibiotic biosynthesis monooxygenase n=1 Tax=Qingshengfaniella alkalisoli TaxID=2599296 RepID=UPI00143CF802|nr:antibiotic biosynthesis monooxygenase [Qingshengfaniella alkalisoli]